MPTGFVRSENKIVQGGHAIYETLAVEAGETVTPGSLVILGSSDTEVLEASEDAVNVIGVADVIFGEPQAPGSREGQEPGVDIPAGDPCRVARGKFLFAGNLADGEDVSKGDKLAPADAGELKLLVLDVTATPTQATIEAALNALASACAVAEESVDNSAGGASTPILATFGGN